MLRKQVQNSKKGFAYSATVKLLDNYRSTVGDSELLEEITLFLFLL